MQNNDEEKRIHAYRGANETVRALYSDLELGGLLGSTSKRLGFTNESSAVFIDVVGDIILGFYPKSDLKKRLMSEVGVTLEVAQQIEADLKGFLSRIDDIPTVPEASKDTRERLDLRPEGVAQGAPGNENATKPLTREEVLRALAPKRTMASDIESIRQVSGVPGQSKDQGTEKSEEKK